MGRTATANRCCEFAAWRAAPCSRFSGYTTRGLRLVGRDFSEHRGNFPTCHCCSRPSPRFANSHVAIAVTPNALRLTASMHPACPSRHSPFPAEQEFLRIQERLHAWWALFSRARRSTGSITYAPVCRPIARNFGRISACGSSLCCSIHAGPERPNTPTTRRYPCPHHPTRPAQKVSRPRSVRHWAACRQAGARRCQPEYRSLSHGSAVFE